jgi:hypothetical protein
LLWIGRDAVEAQQHHQTGETGIGSRLVLDHLRCAPLQTASRGLAEEQAPRSVLFACQELGVMMTRRSKGVLRSLVIGSGCGKR